MSLWHRAQIVWTTLASTVGWSAPPESDRERLAHIDSLYSEYRREFPSVPEIDAATALRWLRDGHDPAGHEILFVDVRTEEERAISTIPGALSAETVERDRARYRAHTLVAYCTIGYRSGRWAERQIADGLSVVNLAGSLLAWTHVAGPLQGKDGPTQALHVYGPAWDLARSDYTAAW